MSISNGRADFPRRGASAPPTGRPSGSLGRPLYVGRIFLREAPQPRALRPWCTPRAICHEATNGDDESQLPLSFEAQTGFRQPALLLLPPSRAALNPLRRVFLCASGRLPSTTSRSGGANVGLWPAAALPTSVQKGQRLPTHAPLDAHSGCRRCRKEGSPPVQVAFSAG